jgi:hypothetical protein
MTLVVPVGGDPARGRPASARAGLLGPGPGQLDGDRGLRRRNRVAISSSSAAKPRRDGDGTRRSTPSTRVDPAQRIAIMVGPTSKAPLVSGIEAGVSEARSGAERFTLAD